MKNSFDRLNLILLNIGFSELNANWNWKNINSPFARIYYVVSGEAKTYINGEKYILRPGNLYLTPSFTLHDDECDSFFSLFYIHFYEETKNQESLFDRFDVPIEVRAKDLDKYLIDRLLEINPNRHLSNIDPLMYDNMPSFSQYIAANNSLPMYSILETQGILIQLLSYFLKDATPKHKYEDERINSCIKFIHENLDKDLTISQLADISCLTKDHLIRIFKQMMGYTPIKYINLKKIEKAQFMLLTTDMTVSEIALELSFDNISYFNRLFKQTINITPSEYREIYRNRVL